MARYVCRRQAFSKKHMAALIGGLLLLQVLVASFWIASSAESVVGAPAAPPYVTYFMIDGLHDETFHRELDAGNLPNMQAMIREGLYVPNGVTSFPSMTAYGFYPFITGKDASTSGIAGLRWFDRTRKQGMFRNYVGRTNVNLNRDFKEEALTVYEHFPGEHSFSIQCYADRGVAVEKQKAWAYTSAKYKDVWYFRLLSWVPVLGNILAGDWVRTEQTVIQEAIADLPNLPKVQWITFASPDGHMHVNGIDAEYTRVLRGVDARIGEYREASRELGQEYERYYVIASDHGVVNVTRNFDVGQWLLDRHGFNVDRDLGSVLGTTELDTPNSHYSHVDVVQAINGNAANYIYVRDRRGNKPWARALSLEHLEAYPSRSQRTAEGDAPLLINLLDEFSSMPAVELVLARNVGAARAMQVVVQRMVEGKRLRGLIHAKQMEEGVMGYKYYITDGSDPIRCTADPSCNLLMDGYYHSADAWLQATYDAQYPYAVVRFYRFMMNGGASAPDLVITANVGYDFGKDYEPIIPNYSGGHGGARQDQMRVPYIVTGPKIRSGHQIDTCTPEDIGATIFAALGIPPNERADGKVIPDVFVS